MTRPTLFIAAVLLALALVACDGGGTAGRRIHVFRSHSLGECPPGYTRDDTEWCRAVLYLDPVASGPTPTPFALPTLTPTAEARATEEPTP